MYNNKLATWGVGAGTGEHCSSQQTLRYTQGLQYSNDHEWVKGEPKEREERGRAEFPVQGYYYLEVQQSNQLPRLHLEHSLSLTGYTMVVP